jgi:hypothetical protein
MTKNQDGGDKPAPASPPQPQKAPPPTEKIQPGWKPKLVPEEVKGRQGDRIERRGRPK